MSARQATADVVPPSKRLYDMAFLFAATKVCMDFCKKFSNRVLDPFCGCGTVLHVAESLCVDIDRACCEGARDFRPAGE